MTDIGTVVATFPSVGAVSTLALKRDGFEAGGGFSVIDPLSLKPLLALQSDDLASINGIAFEVIDAFDWAIDLDRKGLLPVITDEGHLGGLPTQAIRRRAPNVTLRPELAAAFRARIDRWDAEKALASAIAADSDALLKLAA